MQRRFFATGATLALALIIGCGESSTPAAAPPGVKAADDPDNTVNQKKKKTKLEAKNQAGPEGVAPSRL